MYKHLLSFLLLFLLATGSLRAQDRPITGTLRDEQGQPMPGANVVIKGTTRGTTTDAVGEFRLSVPGGNTTLTISSVGYLPKELAVGTGQSQVRVKGSGSAWAGQQTTSQDIMHASEACLLRAEGALNGWNMGGTAQTLHEKGIEMSMKQWGVVDAAKVAAYVGSTKTPMAPGDALSSLALSTIAVKRGGSEAVQREQIGMQKWLALFPDGLEAWAEFRRSRFPKLYPIANSDNPDLPAGMFIRRIPFLDLEKQTNGDAVKAAGGLLGGPDKATTPL